MSIADVQSRVAQIQSQIDALSGAAVGTTSATSGTDFANALTTAQTGTATDGSSTVTGTGVSGDAVVSDARKYLGVPYVWGGTDPSKGLDCSGLVQRVYKDLGIDLPRVSGQQAKVGTAVPSLAQAKPGDILAFGSPVDHVAIYIGNNQMIAAPEPGDHVKVQSVYTTPTAIRRVVSGDLTTASAHATSGAGGVYAARFTAAEQKYGLPTGLLNAVAKVESNYNAGARSPAGALGLMQIMPSTAKGLGVNPLDPSQAIDGAAKLLSRNLSEFKSLPLAIAAYNAGGGAVRHYGGVPPYAETQAYVKKVQAAL